MRAQKAAFETRRSRAHKGDHATGAPYGHFSSGLHRGSGFTETGGHLQVLAPQPEPQETDRSQVLASVAEHDDAAHFEAVQTSGSSEDARVQENGEQGPGAGTQIAARGRKLKKNCDFLKI